MQAETPEALYRGEVVGIVAHQQLPDGFWCDGVVILVERPALLTGFQAAGCLQLGEQLVEQALGVQMGAGQLSVACLAESVAPGEVVQGPDGEGIGQAVEQRVDLVGVTAAGEAAEVIQQARHGGVEGAQVE